MYCVETFGKWCFMYLFIHKESYMEGKTKTIYETREEALERIKKLCKKGYKEVIPSPRKRVRVHEME